MAEIVFDKPNERIARHGVSKCVIAYAGKVYPWNGIVSISQKNTESKGEYVFVDGVAVNFIPTIQKRSYTITCYTYPEIVENLLGGRYVSGGVLLNSGSKKTFDLGWTTESFDSLGNRYEILNILYNVRLHHPDFIDVTHDNSPRVGDIVFETSVIPVMLDSHPQFKISVDSRLSDENVVASIREWMYGSSTKNPSWPSSSRLFDFIDDSRQFGIGAEVSSGLYKLIDGSDLTGSTSKGVYKINNTTSVSEISDGLYRKV